MPLILAGFSWLAGFIATLSVAIIQWISIYVIKRLAVIAAALSAFAVAAVAFYVALGAIASNIAASAPPWFADGCALMLPYNLQECMTAIAAAEVARLIYVWQYRLINFSANVSYGG